MEAKEVFDNFLKELKSSFPEIGDVEYNLDREVKHIEETYYPSVLKIIQKDETFFAEERKFCGINLSELFPKSEETKELVWKNMFILLVASFMHGDINEKVGKILDTVKNVFSSSGYENDEISKILNDEKAEDNFKEILDYVKNTRIAKLFMELVEETNIEELADGFNLENPAELIEIVKNPDHPTMKNIISKVQQKIQLKMQQGQFTQQQLVGEIEGIKLKIQSLFGNVINEFLGGRKADVPSSTLMGNSPEARRQRMLARLQRKQRDKNSR